MPQRDPYENVTYMVGVHERYHTPSRENLNGLSCRTLVPPASAGRQRVVDTDFYVVLGVRESDVRPLPDIIRVSSNLRLYGLEVW